MANTTNFGWETPDDTDLVKDGAAAIRTLGSAIDTSLVDLKGGTTGQILSKTSNTDMDFTWITNDVGDITAVTAGTGISGGGASGAVTITNDMATTITAAGDIVVGTGNATYDNLPIGTTGQVLTADTTVSPYKVKWAAIPSTTPTFSGVKVFGSTTTSITLSDATTTAITWDGEKFDTDGFHSTVTNTDRLTVPTGKGGTYLVTGKIYWDSVNTTGTRIVYLSKNTTVIASYYRFPSATQGFTTEFSTIINLAATDYVKLTANQNSGGNLAIELSDTYSEFGMTFLGA